MAPVHVAALLAHPQVRAAITRALAARGVRGDTQIIHVNPHEEAMLRMLGGSGTINPRTGLRQFDPVGKGGGVGGLGGSDSGAIGGGESLGGGAGTGTNPGGFGQASGGGGYGPLGVIGDIPGAIGRALSGVGGFLGRAAGNFGAGWGSQGVAGGYGGASRSPSGGGGIGASSGSGGGFGGGHSGQNYYSQTYGGLPAQAPLAPAVAPLPQAPVINNMPAAPVTLDPMMSSTATTDLAGSRFGALPSWATTPYQVGTAPSSYPTPGVNAGLGAPGYAGNPLLNQGGGGAPGGGGGAPSGGGGVPYLGGAPTNAPVGSSAALTALLLNNPNPMANITPDMKATIAANLAQLARMPVTHQTPGYAGMTDQQLGYVPQFVYGAPQAQPRAATPIVQAPRPQVPLPGPAMGYVAPRPAATAPATLTAAQKLAAAQRAASLANAAARR